MCSVTPPIINSLGDQLNLPSHSIQFLDTNNYFLKQYIPAMAETRMMGPKVDSPYLRWSNSKLFFSHTLASCIGHGQSFDVVKQLWNQNSAFWSKMIPKNQPYAPVYTLHILIQGTGDGLTVDKVLTYLKDLDDQQLSIRFFWDCLKQVCEDDARSIEVLSALDPVMNAFLVCPNCGDSQTIYAANQSGETLVECFKCNTKLCLSCKRSHQEPCGVYFDNLSDDEKKEYIGKVYGVPVTSLITAENDGLVCDSCFTNPELDEKVVPMTCGTHYLCIDCVKGGCSGSPIADLRKSDNDAAGLPMLYFHCPGDTTNGAGAGPACTGRLPDKLNNQLLAEKITKEEHRLAVLAEGGVHCPGGCEDLILAEDVGGIKRRNKRGTPYICRNKDCPSLQVSASVQNMMVQYQYMAKEALSKYHELNVGIRALDLGLISDEDKVNLLQGFRHSCLNCDVTPYHHGKTCGQYQRDKALSEADVEVKYCPKRSCGVPIQKNEGCSHMVCSQCHYSFCWFCGQKWTGTNSTRSRCSKSSANPNGCPWLPHEIKAYEAARRGEVAPEPAAVDPSEYEEETDAAIREALGEGDAAEQARILRMIQEEANRR